MLKFSKNIWEMYKDFFFIGPFQKKYKSNTSLAIFDIADNFIKVIYFHLKYVYNLLENGKYNGLKVPSVISFCFEITSNWTITTIQQTEFKISHGF